MERWEIRPQPSSDDPERHLLLIRGGMPDVAALLKKFGALCGRPSPFEAEGFNLSVVLHRVTPESRAKLDAWLGAMAPAATSTPAAAPAPAPTPVPAPTPALPPMPSLAPPPTVPPVVAPPSLEAPPLVPPPVLPPTPVPESPLISMTPEPPAPSVSAFPTEVRMATPAPLPDAAAAAPAATPAPAAAPQLVEAAAIPGAAPAAEPLRKDWTFETLLVGAYNRFAHAASMSVVSSPGSMYNPLFLYGVPGTGKSHMLHAIAAGLSKGLGDATLFITSGARLSRAAAVAAARKDTSELDKKIADSKALFVDDVHLLAITDQNKDILAKVFKSFFDKNQQVAITSLYPPRALGALEEALKFSFSKGWSVDLKVPSPAVQKDLIAGMSDRIGAQLSSDEIGLLAEKLTQVGYSDMSLWVRRLGTLRKARETSGQPSAFQDMMTACYDPIIAASTDAPEVPAGVKFTGPAAPDLAPKMAVIVPKGLEGFGAHAANLFVEAGAKNGFPQPCRITLWETYDSSQQFGVPFQIGDICWRAGVTRALVVGPGPDSPLAARQNEFAHAVRRILESGGVSAGWIPYLGTRQPAHFLNAQLDMVPIQS